MCFSAGASLGAVVVLTVIGVATIQKSRFTAQSMFAAIPLIFGIQQFLEAIVWLSFGQPAYLPWRVPASYGFLVFAQIVWPSWVPLSVLAMEKEGHRKMLLRVFSFMGVLVSLFLGYFLLTRSLVTSVKEYHIDYNIDFPAVFSNYGGIFYIIVTVAPTFFSGVKRTWLVAIPILLSLLFTKIFFSEYIISIWCFFAALISVVVYFVIRDEQRLAVKIGTKLST